MEALLSFLYWTECHTYLLLLYALTVRSKSQCYFYTDIRYLKKTKTSAIQLSNQTLVYLHTLALEIRVSFWPLRHIRDYFDYAFMCSKLLKSLVMFSETEGFLPFPIGILPKGYCVGFKNVLLVIVFIKRWVMGYIIMQEYNGYRQFIFTVKSSASKVNVAFC